jgi:hypothetical protein
MPPINESADNLDRRLGKARDLLDGQKHRARHGMVSLLALVGAGVSATLLFTLVFGSEEAPAHAQVKADATPPAFELSSSAISAAAQTPEVPAKPAQPLLVGTEK